MNNNNLENRFQELVKEFENNFNLPTGGYLLIISNGKGFGRCAYCGNGLRLYEGLKHMMLDDPDFKQLIYKLAASVKGELNE